MSATEVLLHEFVHIGTMKYIKDNSVQYDNLIRMVQEKGNRNLIKQIIITLDGGKPNVNTAAKIEYILNRNTPEEAVAQLGAYILQRRVLGDVSEIDHALEKTGLAESLKGYIRGIMNFVATQIQKINNIFLAYRTGDTAAYDEMMVVMDQVFGLSPDGTAMKDVNNKPSGPRYTEEFVTTTFKSDTAVSDAEFAELLATRTKITTEIQAAWKAGNVTLANDLQVELSKTVTALDENGYMFLDRTKQDGQINVGLNQFGLSREQVVGRGAEIKEGSMVDVTIRGKRLSVLDAREILHQELSKAVPDHTVIALLATQLLDNLSKHLGGKMTEGVGGWTALKMDRIWEGKVGRAMRNFLTGFTGSGSTMYSPFILPEILANVLIDGATLTHSRVNPDLEQGTVSAQKARTDATIFEGGVYRALDRLDMALIKNNPEWKAKNKQEQDAEFTKIRLDMSKLLAGGDPDLSGYPDAVLNEVKALQKEWKWLEKYVFPLSASVNRLTMNLDEGVSYPIRLREDGNISSSGLLKPLMQIMNQRITSNKKDVCTPVLYTAGLLPDVSSATTLAADLASIKKDFKGYYAKMLAGAHRHYTRGDLTSFSNLAELSDPPAEVHEAFLKYVQTQLRTFNGSKKSIPTWADLGKGLDVAEVHALKARYSTVIGEAARIDTTKHRDRLNALLKTNWDSTIRTTWLAAKQAGTAQHFDDVVSFLSSNILDVVGHRPFFVQNDTWIPSMATLLNNPDAVTALETDPYLVGRSIARTVGQSASEVAMFADITGMNLDVGEMINIFKLATDPRKAVKLTDGKGNILTDKDKKILSDSMEILDQKYKTLRGVAGSLVSGDDATLLKVAEGSVWAIKIVYGSNLATATALVEGSLASLFSVMGHDPLKGVLLPTMSYLKPLFKSNRKKLKEVAQDQHYIYQMRGGKLNGHERGMVGEVDASGTHLSGTSTEVDVEGKLLKFVRGWGVNSVKHAQYVAAEIKSGLDICARTNILRKLHSTKDGKSSWEIMADLLLNEDVAALIAETSTTDLLAKRERTASYDVWKKLAKKAGWGNDWKLTQSMARNRLMTPEAIKAVQEMDAGSRKMFDHTEGYIDLYKMRQWAMEIDTSTRAGTQRFDTYIDAWRGLRTVIEEQINEIMVSPNVLDMNTATHGMALLVSQYRSYPMLYTNQRIFRDSSRLDPKIWVVKTLTNLILDMSYTMVTMMAGGYLLEDMEEDVSTPEGFASMAGLLVTRLPFFGFWGMVGFELINMLGKRGGGLLTPIGISGTVKWLEGLGGAATGAVQEMVPGGESWDESDTKNAINSLRVFRLLGESGPRAILHNILGDSKFKGSTARFGRGKTRLPFQRANPNYELSSHVVAEAWLKELAPGLWNNGPTWMDERRNQATVQEYLPDMPQEEPMEEEPRVVNEEQAPTEPSNPPQITGGFLRAPEGI